VPAQGSDGGARHGTGVEGPAAAPLEELASLQPTEAVARIERALSTATDPERARALDGDLLTLLGHRPAGDAVLAEIPLDRLEALARRLADRIRASSSEPRTDAWQMLDVVRRPTLLRRISEAGATDLWASLILELIEASEFTFARLFQQRARGYGSRPLFTVPRRDGEHTLYWHQVAGRVDLIARGLLALTPDNPDCRVAILSDNRLDMALLDLACLTSGIVNVMIPATATDRDVAYILEHAKIDVIVVSDHTQLEKVRHAREQQRRLRAIVAFQPGAASTRGVVPFEQLLAGGGAITRETLAERRDRLRVGDLATVMYTSGTTGTPKGICFSHRNIVFKRFARALALPEIGEDDRFLSYLPLFHTFGRFLEMTGCVFWGATYCFAESPAIDSLIGQMNRLQPTVLISIPMKWMELFDKIRLQVDVEVAPDDEIEAAVRRVTGGALRWGLSAAGYLDPEIFRFFQRYGIELMSGFGMTEATGGITMTPPGRYRDDSLGVPLPGIEAMLAEDGELKVRGPYVMMGYLDPPEGEPSFDDDGWLPTGDLMEMDGEGHLRMVDRKKEIYKNIKGQTVAPQKIENLFREFDSVGRIFLVGDHRPYNTALIYPNPGAEEITLTALPPEELKAHFRSLVVSANSFLAPYERIVDFTVIPRDLSAERGELTPKGSFKRKQIERNFADSIRLLYRRTTLQVGGAEVLFPNWLFQALGITAQELRTEEGRLTLPTFGTSLTVRRIADDQVEVGSVLYRLAGWPIDLGLMLSTPPLWLGNEELCGFAPLNALQRDRRRSRATGIEWISRTAPYRACDNDRHVAEAILLDDEVDLISLHVAAMLLGSDQEADALLGTKILEHGFKLDNVASHEHMLTVLRRAVVAPSSEVLDRAFRQLAVSELPSHYQGTVAAFLDRDAFVIRRAGVAHLDLTHDQVAAFLAEAERRCLAASESTDPDPAAEPLLEFLADYGTAHPSRFQPLRAALTRLAHAGGSPHLQRAAAEARFCLEKGFRDWLGAASQIAVDPETGLEFRWDQVISFSDEVDDDARFRLSAAIRDTTMLREAIFLFSGGTVVRLEDLLPSGVWIRLLGSDHGKSVFRVAVKTRKEEQFDLAVNLNRSLSTRQVEEEIEWLMVCSEAGDRGALVEEFGGYWPEYQLWTEEFIPGETLDRSLSRLERRASNQEWYVGIWPSAAWSGLAAYVDFWHRTGRLLVIADPTPNNVIVPMHDYQAGARLVAISSRKPFESVARMLREFREVFVPSIEAEHPRLRGEVGWDVVFSAFLEVVGETEGLALLRGAAVADSEQGSADDLSAALAPYMASVERRGFLPRRLYFAAKRYRRWERLNPDATLSARASTLHEMYGTYRLDDLQATYPEARPRFFRETVFRDARPELEDGLEEIIARLRAGALTTEDLTGAIADLRARLPLAEDEDYFLARLSYPHLTPEDLAAYVEADIGGIHKSEMVVTLEDREDRPYRVRHAVSPKEVARLHRLFVAAQLPVQFRPEHQFLVAVNLRGNLIGGLFYEVQPEEHTAHMDKLVVAEPFRGQGVAGGLLEELCNRLRAAGYVSLTTGFFRPQFFYRYGFTVERRYAGLVRSLVQQEEER
jgi:long-subunit acyl-CoA synthetase (AMP-forming)/GNAT superfamily N-acetyltransferase